MSRNHAEFDLPPHGSPPGSAFERTAPCSACGSETKASTLSAYGTRCWPCFERYCRAAFDGLPQQPSIDRNAMTPAAYCHARLSTQQQRTGKPITDAQRDVMLACAKRAAPATLDRTEFDDDPRFGQWAAARQPG